MRTLVTGCAGFIGSHVTEALLEAGHSVVGIDCFNDNYGREQKLTNLKHVREWNDFEFVPIDLSRGDLLEFVHSTDVVFHLAAEPGVRSSWGSRYSRYIQNNVLATQQLLEASRDAPALRLVLASSSSVYGEGSPAPSTEESATRPISPYGQTKLSAEQLCDLYRRELDMDIVSLRYFTVFGPRQRPDMAFHRFLRAALRDEPITVFGDGGQRRDFTYVADVVAATLAAGMAKTLPERVFNIGGGAPATLAHTLEVIEELVGRRLEVQHAPRKHGDVRDTSADTARARRLLGFSPRTSLEQGLWAELAWVTERIVKGVCEPAL
ncbi:MAG TPA: NAD-dependent epimerase/dehydratase family protein [Solirubrobacteraceae bacterium]|nr:NAD-dependent epimerase/dehydratase family protein [Solirubrobacteraceae bacterium]